MWEVAKGLPAADCGQEAWAVLETLRNGRDLHAVTLQEIRDAMQVALFAYLQKMLALHEAGRLHEACRADRATHFAEDPRYAADRKTFMDLCGISELLEPQAAAKLIKDCENLFSTYVGTLVFQFEAGADAKAAFNSTQRLPTRRTLQRCRQPRRLFPSFQGTAIRSSLSSPGTTSCTLWPRTRAMTAASTQSASTCEF
jgi:hypothetical protein